MKIVIVFDEASTTWDEIGQIEKDLDDFIHENYLLNHTTYYVTTESN